MKTAKPLHLAKWIEDNRHLLKPPVGNQQIYHGNEDFIVMVVGGPNARKDFHVNKGEEIFFQLEGEIEVGIMEDDEEFPGKKREEKIKIGAGELFLLPAGLPHCPRRGPGTIGLVIERYRNENEEDGFQWYCPGCGQLMHEQFVRVSDIVKQLPLVMNAFYEGPESTCQNCGTQVDRP